MAICIFGAWFSTQVCESQHCSDFFQGLAEEIAHLYGSLSQRCAQENKSCTDDGTASYLAPLVWLRRRWLWRRFEDGDAEGATATGGRSGFLKKLLGGSGGVRSSAETTRGKKSKAESCPSYCARVLRARLWSAARAREGSRRGKSASPYREPQGATETSCPRAR